MTAAMEMLSGSEAAKVCRKADIMADAAYAVLCRDPGSCTGNFFIDDEVLQKEGITDFDQYLIDPGETCSRIILLSKFYCLSVSILIPVVFYSEQRQSFARFLLRFDPRLQ